MQIRYYKNEILAGLVSSIAIIPEVMGFALVAKFDPIAGLYTAFILGLIAALLGGRAGLVSAAAGSMAVVAVHLSLSHGTQYVLAAGILAGILQIIFGLLRLGKWVRMIPQTAIFGFVNGLAIVIFSSQLQFFASEGVAMYVIVGLTMAIMLILPKFSRILPAGLVAIVILGFGVYFLQINTKTIGDLGNLNGGLPHFSLPDVPLNFETLQVIWPYSLILALVGLIETLLTLSVMDEMQKTRGNSNKECIAQGLGNSVCGFFGAMSGCVMIGQSIINATSGGIGRISSAMAAIFVLIFVVSIPEVISKIPMGVLVGIMFVVSLKTFEWASISRLRSMKKSDILILLLVTIITVVFDLAIAVIIGVIIAALVFAYQQAKITTTTILESDGTKVYKLKGPLFFGSSVGFVHDLFDVENDPQNVVIDFSEARVMDSSGVDAIDKLTKKYLDMHKSLKLRHLSEDCKDALRLAKKYCTYEIDDPSYKVARDL
ncbi:SulP family inorganic anion transporter [Helicobacter anatolicus]|uniref:SulP family inorganic anion transporter n=1 Tax=Helicobacter anatolicus TaxID=2905874 RepID=UPI001E289765|nr:SulP family inorganic anion transporter [Helicobacter anatolicus]MCE3038512.1 SulP family inorganic anion transporter [Helicobacter anatolicus]